MKPRTLQRVLLKAVRTFPSLVVTGPRQSGKTTLLKTVFSKTHRFVSLENPDVRMRAQEDPLSFLEKNNPPVILDEIQYSPELLSYIKTRIDEKRKPGQWLFTGSQNFPMMQGVSQSLAGRICVLSLAPFSIAERTNQGDKSLAPPGWLKMLEHSKEKSEGASLEDILLRGCYPEIASKKSVDRELWCGSYISTYLERDVRNLSQVGDLALFERFLKLCAVRTGQLLNLSELAGDIGVSVPTARRWLSILETGSQVYLLHPYCKNFGKRLVKAPKIYFTDTGLASYLLGLEKKSLPNSPNFGNLFETLVVTDILKRFLHCGQMPRMYYLRTQDGLEIDLVLEMGQRLYLFEIKSSMTIVPKHASSLTRAIKDLGRAVEKAYLISRSPDTFKLTREVVNIHWKTALAV